MWFQSCLKDFAVSLFGWSEEIQNKSSPNRVSNGKIKIKEAMFHFISLIQKWPISEIVKQTIFKGGLPHILGIHCINLVENFNFGWLGGDVRCFVAF